MDEPNPALVPTSLMMVMMTTTTTTTMMMALGRHRVTLVGMLHGHAAQALDVWMAAGTQWPTEVGMAH